MTVTCAVVSSGDAGSTDGGPAACPNGGTTTISANHGHVLVVSQADVLAGVDKTYSIKGNASHDHTVVVSAHEEKDFAALLQNESTKGEALIKRVGVKLD